MDPFAQALGRPVRVLSSHASQAALFAVGLLLVFMLAYGSIHFLTKHLQQILTKGISYLKFFHASFLKRHPESFDGGQQSALESFYKTQVGTCLIFKAPTNQYRLPYMMRRENAFFEAAKTCWD